MVKARPRRTYIELGYSVLIGRVLQVTVGTLLGALSVVLFFAPAQVAPAGFSGVGVILNSLFDTPIGLVVLLGNVPVLLLAYRMLGGLRAVLWTGYVVLLYSLSIDILTPYLPPDGVSDNALLNTLFAGILGGIGGGLILRGGGTYGGTATLARIIQMKFGTPLSSTYLYSNLVIVLAAGVFLSWESALLAFVALVVEGMASDYVLEGPSVIRTVTIITRQPEVVSGVILYQMNRGVTGWQVTGMYTGEARTMLFVTVARPQVGLLQQLVLEVDPAAFIVINQGHVAYGGGFKRSVPRPRHGPMTTPPAQPTTEPQPEEAAS